MALRDLLVHVDASEAGLNRLLLAADLALRHRARLTVLHVREPSLAQQHRLAAAELGLFSATETEALVLVVEGEIDRDVSLLRGRLDEMQREFGLCAEWRSVAGHAMHVVTQQSRTADLSIIGHDLSDASDLPDQYSFAETMLFMSGRPLLMVPPPCPASPAPATLGRRIALAWNGSRPAARALADALPLIERAERVMVLTASPERLNDASSPDAILAHLGRHAGEVEARMLPADGRHVADALQAEALALGADLLVAGAYGHARLWEKMLGGTTRDLLARMRLPLLMSH